MPSALNRPENRNPQENLQQSLEYQYTPKHGAWLNIAEYELSILARQCLRRRIPDKSSLQTEVSAWTSNRKAENTKTNWRFTTDDARTKLAQLFPQNT
jgi:hypothetical protein